MKEDISLLPKKLSKSFLPMSIFGIIFVIGILGAFFYGRFPQGSIIKIVNSFRNAINDISINGEDDTDDDGLTNDQEANLGTDFKNPDTDEDGYTDGDEIKNGYDPLSKGRLKFNKSNEK